MVRIASYISLEGHCNAERNRGRGSRSVQMPPGLNWGKTSMKLENCGTKHVFWNSTEAEKDLESLSSTLDNTGRMWFKLNLNGFFKIKSWQKLIFHTESILGRRFAKERPRLLGIFNSGFLPISESKYVLKKSLLLSHTATQDLSWESLKTPKSRINNRLLQAQYELPLPLGKFPAANMEHQPFLGHISSNYTQLAPSSAPAPRNPPVSMDRAGREVFPVALFGAHAAWLLPLSELPTTAALHWCHHHCVQVTLGFTFYHRVQVQLEKKQNQTKKNPHKASPQNFISAPSN